MSATTALPSFQNDWLENIEHDEHEGYAHEAGSNVLSAIVHQDTAALRNTLLGIPGPVGELEMLGLLYINEAQPAASEVLRQGFDLLRPAVLLSNAHDYQDEVMGMVRVLAAAERGDPQEAHLFAWLTSLLTEHGTSLALDATVLDEADEDALREVVQRLENRLLRDVLPTQPVPGSSQRPRL